MKNIGPTIKKEISIAKFYEPAFWIGERFFAIVDSGQPPMCVNVKCPVCGSTAGRGKILHTGLDGVEREFDCPYCFSHSKSVASFRNFVVREFYPYKIELQFSNSMSDYKNGVPLVAQSAYLTAFTKTGKCSDDIRRISVPHLQSKYVDDETPTCYFGNSPEIYYYSTKALANKALSYIKEKEKERLAKVNEEYGTNYEYPWD